MDYNGNVVRKKEYERKLEQGKFMGQGIITNANEILFVAVDSSGSIFYPDRTSNLVLARADKNLNLISLKYINLGFKCSAHSLIETATGDFLITGTAVDQGQTTQTGFLVKFNKDLDITSIQTTTGAPLNITVWPNPTSNVVNISTRGKTALTVLNVSGELIHQQEFEDEVQLNTTTWPAGNYFVVASNSTGIGTQQITVVH